MKTYMPNPDKIDRKVKMCQLFSYSSFANKLYMNRFSYAPITLLFDTWAEIILKKKPPHNPILL